MKYRIIAILILVLASVTTVNCAEKNTRRAWTITGTPSVPVTMTMGSSSGKVLQSDQGDNDCSLSIAVTTQGDAKIVKIRLEVPSTAPWGGYYRLEAYTKGPWSINHGGSWYSPIDYNGKSQVLYACGDLPWWGDIYDDSLHYWVEFSFTMRFQDYPWSGGTLYAIAYK